MDLEMWNTDLTLEQLAKIPAGSHTMVTPGTVAALVDREPTSRPRIYGYMERGIYAGQIVSIPSAHYLDKYREDLGAAWVSGVTVADLVRKA